MSAAFCASVSRWSARIRRRHLIGCATVVGVVLVISAEQARL
jgi:hypothetical protein